MILPIACRTLRGSSTERGCMKERTPHLSESILFVPTVVILFFVRVTRPVLFCLSCTFSSLPPRVHS